MSTITNNFAEGANVFNAGSTLNGDIHITDCTINQYGWKQSKALGRGAEAAHEKSVDYPVYAFVMNASMAEAVVAKMRGYMEGKSRSQAKDIMRSVRAAQDAGVIRRMTYDEMKEAFPEHCPKQKSSVSKYTKEDESPYDDDPAFEAMVEEFRGML